MRKAWNKGLTKELHPSVRKISETMKKKEADNFSEWRKGKGRRTYKTLKKDGNLAELIGVVLGDGNIYSFARTEGLRIVGNTKYPGFIDRYEHIIECVFGKRPTVTKRKGSNAANITLYEKYISRRLGIPVGSKRDLQVIVPNWIVKEKANVIRFLRGLYESDGCYSVHKATYTYKFTFSNRNQTLLDVVYVLVSGLGFHPHRTKYAIQVSRKEEVQNLKNLLQFRNY